MKHTWFLAVLIGLLSLSACEQSDKKASMTTQNNAQLEAENMAQVLAQYPSQVPEGRLPASIRPTEYQVDLTIDPEQTLFSGHVAIQLEIESQTSFIWLHARDISANRVELVASDGSLMKGVFETAHDSGVVKINFQQSLPLGKAQLNIDYTAPFNEALEGLYRVKDGEHYYAFTQFEAIAARLAFPSFDEPSFKVPFKVSLTIPSEQAGFSNTPLISETELENGMKLLEFAPTKPLPTYLIAFAVGPFDVVEWQATPANSLRKREIPLRGIATKGKGEGLKYALENSDKILLALEDYFQIPYPYAKLDIVAVPDFQAGAMENAGLITYREQLLLFDKSISLNQKRRYMNVHAHELAHQWFGNLVTPEWWDDIWLNEAFATWMARSSLDNIMPEQKFRQTMLASSLRAMGSDSLISARQIRQPIDSSHDIQSAFDSITYSKGGGVLSMIEAFMTPEKFREGIQHYMQRHAFANATSTDFITAIGEKADVPVEIIRNSFNSFLEQAGIPYLDIATSCVDNKASVQVKQSRYLPIGSKGSSKQTWQIPACMGYQIDGNSHQYCKVLDKAVESFELPEAGCPTYLMPNSQGSGYFRYSLSSDDWQNLLANKEKLSTEEMMSVNDSFTAAVNAGQISFADLIAIAPNIIESDSSRVASAPMSMLSFAYDRIAKTPHEKSKLALENQKLYSAKLQKLGLATPQDDSVDNIQMRNSLIGFLATQGEDQQIRDYLTQMAVDYTGYKTDSKIHSDKADSNVIGSALTIAVDELGPPFARHLMDLFEQQNDGTIRGRLLNGFTSSKDPQLAKELRGWTLSDTLRDNEIYYVIYNQISEKTLEDDMWQWFKANIEGIKERIPPFGQNQLPRIGGVFCSADKRQDFIKFFTPIVGKIAGAPRPFKQAIESIELCEAMVEHHSTGINQYINSL